MAIREVSKELQKVAEEEINENPSRIQSDLRYIKEWISKQPHLNARTDDQFLITFLRGTKFSLERTKEKLDMHYTLKTLTPEFFQNRDPFDPEIQKILSLGYLLPLPKLPHPAAPRHLLLRSSVQEKHKLDQATTMKVCGMIQDILMLEDDNFTIAGSVFLQDMSDITMGFIKLISVSLIKKGMMVFQTAYPHRIKGMRVFNASKAFDALYAISKPFLTEKIKQRISVHSSFDEVCKIVPKEIFPNELEIEDIIAFWKAKVESYKDWFLEDENFRTDESRRLGQPKTPESVFGVDGSFRKLEVD